MSVIGMQSEIGSQNLVVETGQGLAGNEAVYGRFRRRREHEPQAGQAQ